MKILEQDFSGDSFRVWLNGVHLNINAIKLFTEKIKSDAKELKNSSSQYAKKKEYLLKAITFIDLTTLSGDDTPCIVERLCETAVNPLPLTLLKSLNVDDTAEENELSIRTAAVCVYPARVVDCVNTFNQLKIKLPIASVATGFPSGQYSIESRLAEIKFAIENGANEIDVVINRCLALTGDWTGVYDEIKQMKRCTGEDVHLKVIIEAGELGSLYNVYKASWIAMLAGADFIKTSTGKATINATLPIGVVMVRAIADFQRLTGKQVGFKPAGGIKTADDVLEWLLLIEYELGEKWLNQKLFRIGASSVLKSIESELKSMLR